LLVQRPGAPSALALEPLSRRLTVAGLPMMAVRPRASGRPPSWAHCWAAEWEFGARAVPGGWAGLVLPESAQRRLLLQPCAWQPVQHRLVHPHAQLPIQKTCHLASLHDQPWCYERHVGRCAPLAPHWTLDAASNRMATSNHSIWIRIEESKHTQSETPGQMWLAEVPDPEPESCQHD